MFLLPKINFILEKQTYKKDTFMIFGFNNFEIVFNLLTKVVIFYIQDFKI